MEMITQYWELLAAIIGLVATSGLFAAVRKAAKENKDAYKQGEIILQKIKLYRAGGFSKDEIKDLVNQFEIFAKEGKEALEANKTVFGIVQKIWKSAKK